MFYVCRTAFRLFLIAGVHLGFGTLQSVPQVFCCEYALGALTEKLGRLGERMCPRLRIRTNVTSQRLKFAAEQDIPHGEPRRPARIFNLNNEKFQVPLLNLKLQIVQHFTSYHILANGSGSYYLAATNSVVSTSAPPARTVKQN